MEENKMQNGQPIKIAGSIRRQKERVKNMMRKGEQPTVVNLLQDNHGNPPSGDEYGKCKICGKKFHQRYNDETNKFSSFDICETCKKEKSQQKEEKVVEDIKSGANYAKIKYTPYPWQKEAEEAFYSHRFIVLSCGNRCGKDRFTNVIGIKYFVECLNENRLITEPDLVPPVYWWQIAPVEKMAKQNWRELKQFFPREWVVRVSDSDYTMETVFGGIIEVRSGYDPQGLTGVGLDLVTITEAARFSDLEEAWGNLEARLGSPKRGRKIDRNGECGAGKAIINSSPLGKNDFYYMWCRGQKDNSLYSSLWWSATYPWTANPVNAKQANELIDTRYGKITYEESLRRQRGERVFRSNYLADFLAEDSAVFKNLEEKCVISIYDEAKTGAHNDAERKEYIKKWREPILGDEYICGYDPATGSSGDSPVMIIRHKKTGKIVCAYDMYGKNYTEQYEFISSICKKYNYATVNWLRTGHTAIAGEFEKRGLNESPIDENGQKKRALVNMLEIAVENGDISILYDGSAEMQMLIDQLNDYSEKNGKYSNNKMPHDDYVSALYAAFSDYNCDNTPAIYYGRFEKI